MIYSSTLHAAVVTFLRMRVFNVLLLSAMLVVTAGPVMAVPLKLDYNQSRINVAVSATIDSFVGRLQKYQATIDCSSGHRLPGKAKVAFDFADLKTGNPDRDAAMRQWLGYDANPTASFVLTGWKQNGTTNLALGDLTIHGVQKAITMPVTVINTGNRWDISGEADLDYRDFNLPIIHKMLVLTVHPNLKVTFHLAGRLPADQ